MAGQQVVFSVWGKLNMWVGGVGGTGSLIPRGNALVFLAAGHGGVKRISAPRVSVLLLLPPQQPQVSPE